MIRILDIIFSLTALVILSPLFLIVGIAIRLETIGSPIFRQERVGLNGQRFFMCKFRSMVRDAPELGGYSTRPGDPRITRIGRFIRSTSIDELPQLWNVLIGDMGLVGPRPDVPAQEELYDAADRSKRLSVRPGVTGLAQVTRRSKATAAERLEKDLEYVDNQSLGLYFAVLGGTIKLVLTKLAH